VALVSSQFTISIAQSYRSRLRHASPPVTSGPDVAHKPHTYGKRQRGGCVQHQTLEMVCLGMGLVRQRGVAADSIAAWVDARPYRLKLLLLAHTGGCVPIGCDLVLMAPRGAVRIAQSAASR